jgi:hypothetical protein
LLSALETFEYGALGALGSLLFAQALPWGLALLHGAELHITPTRIVGLVVVIAGTMALGGLVAYLIGDATAREAVLYGLGWQGAIGGFIQGTRSVSKETEA